MQSGDISKGLSGNSIPGSGNIGSAQNITAFLLIWAKFFDELKLFIDHFSKILNLDYDDKESVVDKLLPAVARYYGITLPAIYPNTNPEQYIHGENLGQKFELAENPLKYIQSQIWKRVLINFNDIRASKGTIHSIKSLIRSAGINPDSLMSIREYGGPTKKSLDGLRQKSIEISNSLDFSGSISSKISTINSQGFSDKYPRIVSKFLSSSRTEVGFPDPSGIFVKKNQYYPHGISNNTSDGLLTSGSFTYEGIYQFDPRSKSKFNTNQSAVRLNVSCSNHLAPKGISYANLLIISGTQNSLTSSGSTLRLYMRPGTTGISDKLLKIDLPGPNIFDGNKWNISFGRERSDQKKENSNYKILSKNISNERSSSYFIRCARQSFGEIKEVFLTSSFFQESSNSNTVLSKIDNVYNPSGSMIVIGSQSMANFSSLGTAYNVFLNDSNLESRVGASSGDFNLANFTNFQGKVSQIRFWSKALSENEWREHVRNFKSIGVKDPVKNLNFEKLVSGSFERLRINATIDQEIVSASASGEIQIFDFSQNNFHFDGAGFEKNKKVIKPESFYYSYLSPKFDQSQTDNKVRVRSYQDEKMLKESTYASSAPRFEVLRSEEPDDDTRFSIDFSAVKALDEDIMNIFSDLSVFDNALGNVNMLFDESYPDIEQLRKIYFKRLTDKPDFEIFFEMYRWFNTALGSLVEQLIPRKTKFLGINFVIESHVLERNRFRYLFDDIYLNALQRDTNRGNLLLSQFVGKLKKY